MVVTSGVFLRPSFRLMGALFLTMLVLGTHSARASNNPRLKFLQQQLARAHLEQQRWQRVIDTEHDLVIHPNKYSSDAEDAARSLEASGRDLVIDGVTGGISTLLKVNADMAGPETKTGRAYSTYAAGIGALSNNLVKNYARPGDPEQTKPSEENSRDIDKLESALRLSVEAVKDPRLRSALSASVGMHVAALQFLNAYLVDDKPGMAKYFPATKSLLEGTLDVIRGMAAHPNPEQLEGYLSAVVREVPEFEPIIKALGTTALDDTTLAFSAANIGFGVWSINKGMALDAKAIDIRDNQMHAAGILRRLLPLARIELKHAEMKQRQISAAIARLRGNSPKLPPVVSPSERVVDDTVGEPDTAPQVLDLVGTIDRPVELKHGIMPEALRALENKFRKASQADLDRREALRRAEEEEARREAEDLEEAQRATVRQFRWSSRRSQQSGRSWRSSSSTSEYHGSSFDLDSAEDALQDAEDIANALGGS